MLGIDAALADILTTEQSTAYEELKTNERNRRIESKAYKDLARVNSVLDLSDEEADTFFRPEAGVGRNDDGSLAFACGVPEGSPSLASRTARAMSGRCAQWVSSS